MFKNPFVILGVDENATQAEVQEAYERLKNEYRQEIHVEGDGGKRAAKKLSELEDAYREVMERLSSGAEVKGIYEHVVALLKAKKIDEAQAALDKISERDADWHYYQSAVYHAKGWYYEAKAQLDMAINMDPQNEKYKETMERMKQHDASSYGETSGGAASGANAGRAGYDTYEEMGRSRPRVDGSDCCMSLLCADCCCECMGGDLIRCC